MIILCIIFFQCLRNVKLVTNTEVWNRNKKRAGFSRLSTPNNDFALWVLTKPKFECNSNWLNYRRSIAKPKKSWVGCLIENTRVRPQRLGKWVTFFLFSKKVGAVSQELLWNFLFYSEGSRSSFLSLSIMHWFQLRRFFQNVVCPFLLI